MKDEQPRASSDGHKQNRNNGVSILIADDDPAMRSLVSDELREEGYRVTQVSDGQAVLECVGHAEPDLVITDLRMPHGGMESVARLRAAAPGMPIILMTAFGDKATESLAYKWGASAYFNKPVRMAQLKETVRILLDGDAQKKRRRLYE
ncbi:MAG: response regulator [Nitrospirae bacterium]|nr:MAG: response regulator [Nitrospirota bacterium]